MLRRWQQAHCACCIWRRIFHGVCFNEGLGFCQTNGASIPLHPSVSVLRHVPEGDPAMQAWIRSAILTALDYIPSAMPDSEGAWPRAGSALFPPPQQQSSLLTAQDAAAAPATSAGSTGWVGAHTAAFAGILVGAVLLAALLAGLLCLCCGRARRRGSILESRGAPRAAHSSSSDSSLALSGHSHLAGHYLMPSAGVMYGPMALSSVPPWAVDREHQWCHRAVCWPW